jgi:hypothetical protein
MKKLLKFSWSLNLGMLINKEDYKVFTRIWPQMFYSMHEKDRTRFPKRICSTELSSRSMLWDSQEPVRFPLISDTKKCFENYGIVPVHELPVYGPVAGKVLAGSYRPAWILSQPASGTYSVRPRKERIPWTLEIKGDLLLVWRSEVVLSVFKEGIYFLPKSLMCWPEGNTFHILRTVSSDFNTLYI